MSLILIGALAVLLCVAALIIGLLVLALAKPSPKVAWPASPRADVPPEARNEAERLIAEGRHVEAIKVVRAHTSWGLVDAKNYVDSLRRGDAQPPRPGTPIEPSPQVRLQAQELAARGELVDAVRLVRQQTGLGLKDATEYVRGLQHS